MTQVPVVETTTFNLDSPGTRGHIWTTTLLAYALVWFFVSLLFVGVGLTFQGSIDREQLPNFAAVMFVGGPVYFALTFGISAYRLARKSLARLRATPEAALCRCQFTPSGLRWESDAGMYAYVPYRLVHKLAPDLDGITAMVDSARILWIPREAFKTVGDFEEASRWCLTAQLAKSGSSGSLSRG